MARAVWKFGVPLGDVVTIDMPEGAQILHVQAQNDIPCMWALVDPLAQRVSRRFRFAGTGHEISESPLEHVGSFFMREGALVFHLFELSR